MKINGYTIYDGPSMLNGEPIVAILTGFAIASANGKVGARSLQTWILPRDVNPLKATLNGQDAAVCGDCPHRGHATGESNPGRSCYVEVHFGVRNIWLAWQRGNYPDRHLIRDLIELGHGRVIRLGSYGDPAAVPFWVWRSITHACAWSMGYTHQWRLCHEELKRLCMASVDSEDEQREAKSLGWRTFRVRSISSELMAREIICPASAEARKKTSCADCRACGGTNAKAKADIAIIAHGSPGRSSNFEKRQIIVPTQAAQAPPRLLIQE